LFQRRFAPAHRFRIQGRVMMVLHGDLRKLRKGRAIFSRMLATNLGEHRRHRAGPEHTLRAESVSPFAAPEEAFAHLLHTDCEHQVVETRLDRNNTLTEGSSTRSAGIGGVYDGDSRLSDLAQDPLAYHEMRF